MVVPAAGDVVLVPFPFSDLSTTKVRPAVCLADTGRGDWVCQVTTSPYGDSLAEPLEGSDFAIGGLPVASFARSSKLFTASASLLVGIVERLNGPAMQRLLDAAVRVFRPGP